MDSLSAGAASAWASPIDYTRATDEALWYGLLFTIAFLALFLCLALYGLWKYTQKYKQTRKGWPPWAVVLSVVLVIAFWIMIFVFYIQGEGARYIGRHPSCASPPEAVNIGTAFFGGRVKELGGPWLAILTRVSPRYPARSPRPRPESARP